MTGKAALDGTTGRFTSGSDRRSIGPGELCLHSGSCCARPLIGTASNRDSIPCGSCFDQLASAHQTP